MAKSKTLAFQFECSECKARNYVTSKNPIENKEKLELSKFCNKCRKHTPHKEVKISKAKK
ncbi:TPA: 50S ribosomal protein L33 [Candidatus Berkelbacteria bacterium]|uniref:Large ribosomal subunit protein bL33 n=1 Tax=Berkelbacteria bacterium GW2011_GWE1_39_12 TaxID=1618337 RepID=A0A0G4B4H3_9BACT|nr:MAG: 50S ribosomal protein L33 [Berkelbacteria bacterium GW2011_GWE1_39_12]HBO60479.1 50S ribosomal protein L33 [Candidatus Berkelbacteria bacterium]